MGHQLCNLIGVQFHDASSHFFSKMLPLWPPKPRGIGHGVSKLRLPSLTRHHIQVALRIRYRIADGGRQEAVFQGQGRKMASTAPAAPSMWPVMDLVELTARCLAWSPNTALMAAVSPASLRRGGGAVGVDVIHLLGQDAAVCQSLGHGLGAASCHQAGGAVM